MRQLLGRDPDPGVGHDQREPRLAAAHQPTHRDPDLTAVAVEHDAVLDHRTHCRLHRRALAAEGLLILADYFVDPQRKTNPHAVLMGATMMASTVHGNGFTTDEYATWIRDAGFGAVRLIEPIGFQQQLIASKPRPIRTS